MDKQLLKIALVLKVVHLAVQAEPLIAWSKHEIENQQSDLVFMRVNPQEYKQNSSQGFGSIGVHDTEHLFGALTADSHLNNTVFVHNRISGNVYLVDLVLSVSNRKWAGTSKQLRDLAVDWLNKNLYYSDPSLGVGLFSYKNNSYFTTVAVLTGSSFNGIDVDPLAGYLFVVDESGGRILRSSLAGNSRSAIVSGLQRPTLVVADIQTKSLIWIDIGIKAVQKSDYNGRSRQTIWASNTIESETFSGLDLYEDYLFMALRNQSVILMRNKTNGDYIDEMIFDKTSTIHYGLAVADTAWQKLVNVPCSARSNGGCDHICTSGGTGSSPECLCQFGYKLGMDGSSCLWAPLMDNFLLIMDDEARQLYQIGLHTQTVHALRMSQENSHPNAVVYDPMNHQVFWTEYELKQIRRLDLETKKEDVFFHLPNAASQGLAIDVRGRSIFYTDGSNEKICRVSLRNMQHTTVVLLSSNEKPFGIQLDETKGIIYWTEFGRIAKIEKANMDDGSQRQTLAEGDMEMPSGLALDIRENHLYWVDNSLMRLERVNLDGSGREFIMTPPCPPFTLTLDKTYLYIGCSNEIIKVEKENWTVADFGPKTFSSIYSVYLFSSSEVIPPTATDPPKVVNKRSLVVAAVVVGAVVVVGIITAAIIMVRRNRKKRTSAERSGIIDQDTMIGGADSEAYERLVSRSANQDLEDPDTDDSELIDCD